MTTPAPSPTKVCIRCGLDCSKRPRTKDLQGRYTCRECFDAMQGEQAIVLPSAADGAKAAAGQGAAYQMEAPADGGVGGGGGGEAEGGGDGGDNDIYALMLDDAVQEAAKVTSAPCPGCGRSLKSDAALCVHCGYNARTGKVVTTKQGEATVADVPMNDKARARQRERELSAWAMKMEYIKPVILMAIGLSITCTLLNNRGAGVEGIIGYLFAYGISIPVTVAAFLMCCSLWIGFDAPLILLTLRLAGIHALLDVLVFGVSYGGFGFGVLGFRFLLPLLIYTALLMHFMEMDYEDAMLAGAITGLLRIVGTICLLFWIANTFGG